MTGEIRVLTIRSKAQKIGDEKSGKPRRLPNLVGDERTSDTCLDEVEPQKHQKPSYYQGVRIRTPVCQVALGEPEDDQGASNRGEASAHVVELGQRRSLAVETVLGGVQRRDRELRRDSSHRHEDCRTAKDPREARAQGPGQETAQPVPEGRPGRHEAEDARLADAGLVHAAEDAHGRRDQHACREALHRAREEEEAPEPRSDGHGGDRVPQRLPEKGADHERLGRREVRQRAGDDDG